MKPKVLMIVGPTAVGKTSLSIKLAKKYRGEIISGDSMQIYRHLDIGTAKVTAKETAGIPHHLIDICNISQRYTAYDFQQQASHWITKLQQTHKLPIIVGGTGFYLNALRLQLNLGTGKKSVANEQSRHKWENFYETVGADQAWQYLEKLDPVAAHNIPITNRRRIVRALEVIDTSGEIFSRQTQRKSPYDTLIIGLNTERTHLYQRIEQRVDLMVQTGLVSEAKWLYKHRISSPQASRGIGYKELFPYFAGELSLEAAIDTIKKDSRHYAKRQLTYFRHQMPVHWFDPFDDGEWLYKITKLVSSWLN